LGQCWHRRRGPRIFYDLGNFIYNVPPTLTYIDEPMAWESVVTTIQFETGPRNSAQPVLTGYVTSSVAAHQ
jgi:hypothetical protein